jgi:hypothetical protein
MIFLTRELYKNTQSITKQGRAADREWWRRLKIYEQYESVISPLLPRSVIQFGRKSFHDAVIESVSQSSGRIVLILDARPCVSGSFHGHRVRLTFEGVRRSIRTRGLAGQWWFYHEVHLCSRAKFSLHLLFTNSDLEIESDEIQIEKL